MTSSSGTYWMIGGVALAIALLFNLLAPFAAGGIEQQYLSMQYQLRGEARADTSIVILYFNNDDISSLGGLPLKRSYYALLIDVLHKLGAKAIGIDIAFTEPDRDHPEYDQLLSFVTRQAGNVIVTGYFRELVANGSFAPEVPRRNIPERFLYPVSNDRQFWHGTRFEAPFPSLLDASAGVGHTNFRERFEIPVFARRDDRLLPAFGLELLRAAFNVSRTDVRYARDRVTLGSGESVLSIPVNSTGEAILNFPGGKNSFQIIPVVPLLRAVDAWMKGSQPEIPIEQIRGKIVLIAFIAEGRSIFAKSPFDEQLPLAAVHATFLHDALQGEFLANLSELGTIAVMVIAIATCTLIAARRGVSAGLAVMGLVLILYLVSSYLLFAKLFIVAPITPLGVSFLLMAVGFVVFERRHAKGRVLSLSDEKQAVETRLREKEDALQRIHRELADLKQSNRSEESHKLSAKLVEYEQEVQRLRGSGEDLEPFVEKASTTAAKPAEFHGIIYDAAGPMAGIVEFIQKIADNSATVLIQGESGTGKELVARAIHAHSGRRDQPFVAVNCGALTETLLESELFGHARGAFTGAIKDKPGRFDLANGGTIFLDEIGETSEAFQVKLLRVLQDGIIERVGGTESTKVDVRVLAATNRDLRKAVQEKQFRQDLYYRLNVFSIDLPPLNKRPRDIALLVAHLIQHEAPGMSCSTAAMHSLQQYHWKGNVREVQSVIKRAVLLATSEQREMLRQKDLPPEIRSAVDIDLEDQIISLLREKGFSRNAISETGQDLGGLNRGTVAEYFRGYCFKQFVSSGWNIDLTADRIAPDADPATKQRVRKKISEYLLNAVEYVDHSQPLEAVRTKSRSKCKNLPQRYHDHFEEVIRSFHAGQWSVDGNDLTAPPNA